MTGVSVDEMGREIDEAIETKSAAGD